jgi:hypothetical protein
MLFQLMRLFVFASNVHRKRRFDALAVVFSLPIIIILRNYQDTNTHCGRATTVVAIN